MLQLTRTMFLILVVVMAACAGKREALDVFGDHQKKKIIEKSAYVQADFDFWAALYEPNTDDLEGLRNAWIEHGDAFPESKPIADIEKEVRKNGQRVVLVSLFMTSYENADLRDKSLAWTVHPVPNKMIELSETDLVLRRFMPVRNRWARYFMLIYSRDIWQQASTLVIADATSRVELKRTDFGQ